MRTPNCNCIICEKPLYRRPFELKEVNFVCCVGCRGAAYKKYPNKKGLANLELGREKGTNHLEGIPKSAESKRKRSKSHKKWCAENPDKVKARGKKTRGKNHYKWKGGSTKLNTAIRLLTENRKWMDAVKERDKKCIRCGSIENLESHHKIPIALYIAAFNIKTASDTRKIEEFWDIANGETLCRKCHYKEHGRTYAD